MAESVRVEAVDLPALLNTLVRGLLGTSSPRIYEAGGGSRSCLDPGLRNAGHVSVVDLSPEQISRCNYAAEAHVGNIETWRRIDAFDLVCCSNVLEHVDAPQAALENFADCLAPGGVCVVTGPIPTSLQGWTTRLTPHGFHVWYYRYFRGSVNAGKPGYTPFPVRFAHGADERDMVDILTRAGLEVLYLARYEGSHARRLRETRPILFALYRMICGTLQCATLGRYRPRLSDFVLIARKPAGATEMSASEPTQTKAVA